MPAVCALAVVQPASVSAPPAIVLLWLAVAFHVAWTGSGMGSAASISATVQLALRAAVAARTRATSAGA